MADPIDSQDVYGPSNPPAPEGQTTAPSGLPIEETPEIPMPQPTAPPPPAPVPKSSFGTMVGLIILFIGLFALGIWGSGFMRQLLPGGLPGMTPSQQQTEIIPTAKPTSADPTAGWKTYRVTSGITKLPIEGVSYKLPGDVLAPICDTGSCMSQGTYLPGGTRFTIAPRGQGQLLADFRGSVITDVGGTAFTVQDTTVVGHAAKSFAGSFSGKTVGGYGFSQMRGLMVEVTPALSLEVNHFTPIGVTADFAKDDTLFDQIVKTLVIPAAASPTAVLTPLPTLSTSSGLPARAN